MQFASWSSYWKEHGWLMTLFVLSSFGMTFPMASIASVLNRELGIPASGIMIYYSVTYIPWNFRCLYGIISDNCSIFGSRRKPYMVASNLILSICFVVYGQTVNSYAGACCVGIIMNVFYAFSQTVMDALAVDTVNSIDREPQNSPPFNWQERWIRSVDIQSSNIVARTFGSLIAFFIAGRLSDLSTFTPRNMISTTAIFPLLMTVIAGLLIKDDHNPDCTNIFALSKEVFSYMKKGNRTIFFNETISPVLYPAIFVFVYASCPSSTVGYMSYLYTEVPSLSDSDFNLLFQLETAAGLIGTLVFWVISRKTEKIRSVFAVTIVGSAIITLTRIPVVNGWHSYCFIVADGALISLVSRVSLMPIQVYASAVASDASRETLCGCLFALFSSVVTWGGTISGLIASVIIRQMTTSNFIVTCSAVSLVPLLLISLLRSPQAAYRLEIIKEQAII